MLNPGESGEEQGTNPYAQTATGQAPKKYGQAGGAGAPGQSAPPTSPTAGMTHAQMQTQGFARPAPTDVRGWVNENMVNPLGAYTEAEMYRKASRDGGAIDDKFALDRAKLKEEMAARGLGDSSIAGGRYADMNVEQRTAKTNLIENLTTERAKMEASARVQAIAQALQLMGMDQQQAMEQARLQQAQEAMDRQSGQFSETMGFNREQAGISQSNWEKSFGQSAQQWKDQFGFNKEQADLNQGNWQKSYDAGRDDQNWSRNFTREDFDWRKSSWNDQFQADLLRFFGLPSGQNPTVSNEPENNANQPGGGGGTGYTYTPPPPAYKGGSAYDDFMTKYGIKNPNSPEMY